MHSRKCHCSHAQRSPSGVSDNERVFQSKDRLALGMQLFSRNIHDRGSSLGRHHLHTNPTCTGLHRAFQRTLVGGRWGLVGSVLKCFPQDCSAESHHVPAAFPLIRCRGVQRWTPFSRRTGDGHVGKAHWWPFHRPFGSICSDFTNRKIRGSSPTAGDTCCKRHDWHIMAYLIRVNAARANSTCINPL